MNKQPLEKSNKDFTYSPDFMNTLLNMILGKINFFACKCLINSKKKQLYSSINQAFFSKLDVTSFILNQLYLNKLFELLFESKEKELIENELMESLDIEKKNMEIVLY